MTRKGGIHGEGCKQYSNLSNIQYLSMILNAGVKSPWSLTCIRYSTALVMSQCGQPETSSFQSECDIIVGVLTSPTVVGMGISAVYKGQCCHCPKDTTTFGHKPRLTGMAVGY